MRRILIVTSSKYGHTRRIARHLARKIEAVSSEPCEFLYYDIAKDFRRELPGLLETVVVGSSIRFGRMPRKLEQWVHRHRFELMALRASFFMVCLNAADARPEAREADMQILERFVLKTRWQPASHRIFAGALCYRQYPFLLRMIMRRISAAQGGPTDTSRNHDLTDYAKVDAFAFEIIREIANRHSIGPQPSLRQIAK